MKKTILLTLWLTLTIAVKLSAADYYTSPNGTGDGSSYSNLDS